MSDVEDKAKKFWCAAFLIRRAPGRDNSTAVAALKEVTDTATGKLQSRAADMLKEHNGE